jgi:hypothetical protein
MPSIYLTGELLEAVIHACGKRQAACLVGSSQGACAVFNAQLHMPRLARSLAVCHPVGHDVARYSAIQVSAAKQMSTRMSLQRNTHSQ